MSDRLEEIRRRWEERHDGPARMDNHRRVMSLVGDIPYLLAEIDRLQALVDELHSVLQEAAEEIEYWHSDMLSPEERAHPRGSGWARVYGRIKDALGGQIQSRRCETCRWWYGACDVLSQTTHRNFGCARWEAESKP